MSQAHLFPSPPDPLPRGPRVVTEGAGWQVVDLVCSAGPGDRPFEEMHEQASIALVLSGSFRYRSTSGTALMVPGAALLGNRGQCYECGHEHAAGDRCLIFRLAPEMTARVAADIPGARRADFAAPYLPPGGALAPLAAQATAALAAPTGAADPLLFEELAVELCGLALEAQQTRVRPAATPTSRDEKRITAAVRYIENRAERLESPLTIAELAAVAMMSPYHFIRTFKRVSGTTPYRFVLHSRLTRAAVRLKTTSLPVTDIAYGAGFGDLSNFTRSFRSVIGLSPGAWRG